MHNTYYNSEQIHNKYATIKQCILYNFKHIATTTCMQQSNVTIRNSRTANVYHINIYTKQNSNQMHT